MTIENGRCDFCAGSAEVNPETHFDTMVVTLNNGEEMFWCGSCREGSREYFKDKTDDEIDIGIELCEALVVDDPPRFDVPKDSSDVVFQKMMIADDLWRGKRERDWRARGL